MQKVVMVDQDGVVVDTQYQVTQNVTDIVASFRQQGLIIVPNSDTPVQRLKKNIADWLGFAPEVTIGEKGAVISNRGACTFVKNVTGIGEYIRALQNTLARHGASVHAGDSATWIRERKTFPSGQRLLIVDALRQQSIGFYLLVSDSMGATHIDVDWSNEAIAAITQLSLPAGLEPLDYNQSYGIAIAHASGVTKTDGYRVIRGVFGDVLYYMVGDQLADFIDDPCVTHCAVGNATDGYKDRAAFIATADYTAGLAECLRWIAEQ
ncbi:MAG: hypothetical protein Q8Q23_02040 [bacterium]|nr:hypothetical protein [bacterium]